MVCGERDCYFQGFFSMDDMAVAARLFHLVVCCLYAIDERCCLLADVDICFQAGL